MLSAPPRRAASLTRASAAACGSPASDAIVPYFGELFTDEPLPEGGFIDLPDRPGFGVTLNRENLVRPYPRTAEESAKQARANIERPAPKVARMPF